MSARQERDKALVVVPGAIALAVVLTATSGEYAPMVAQVAGPALVLCGLVPLGRSVGWRSLALVTVCVVLVGYLGSALFYDNQADVPPDLRTPGMDEISRDPAGVMILLPVIWIVLAGSVLSRRSADQSSERHEAR